MMDPLRVQLRHRLWRRLRPCLLNHRPLHLVGVHLLRSHPQANRLLRHHRLRCRRCLVVVVLGRKRLQVPRDPLRLRDMRQLPSDLRVRTRSRV